MALPLYDNDEDRPDEDDDDGWSGHLTVSVYYDEISKCPDFQI